MLRPSRTYALSTAIAATQPLTPNPASPVWFSPTKLIPFYGGAEHHDYHHWVGGLSSGNFASVFTWCDYIYGTDKGFRFQKKRTQSPQRPEQLPSSCSNHAGRLGG